MEHSIPSSDAYPPVLSSLNLNRELFRQEISPPRLLWLPDYALTALARGAPDFWAWRSGLYEFAPEPKLTESTLEPIRDEALHVTSSLSEQAERERLTMLKGLLADYRELGNGPRELEAQCYILNRMGLIHSDLGEWADARRAYEGALTIGREQDNKFFVAVAEHNLGELARSLGEYAEAKRLLTEESLSIKRSLEYKLGTALSLHQLGIIAQMVGEYDEAKRLYEESLSIKRELGDAAIVSSTLFQLGRLAQIAADYAEARRLYEETLSIKHGVGDKAGEALSLHQLGILAEIAGDYVEARRLYEESLRIMRELGDKEGVALSYGQLGLLDEAEAKYKEGVEHTKLAEELMLSLGNRSHIERITEQRERLEEKAAEQGLIG